MVKKMIKHLTCRRNLGRGATTHRSEARNKRWKQTFTKGYMQQAFKRAGVREGLRHGVENAPFLQREDARRAALGKVSETKRDKEEVPTICEVCEAHGKQ